jgi:hypothetical protein
MVRLDPFVASMQDHIANNKKVSAPTQSLCQKKFALRLLRTVLSQSDESLRLRSVEERIESQSSTAEGDVRRQSRTSHHRKHRVRSAILHVEFLNTDVTNNLSNTFGVQTSSQIAYLQKSHRNRGASLSASAPFSIPSPYIKSSTPTDVVTNSAGAQLMESLLDASLIRAAACDSLFFEGRQISFRDPQRA